MRTTFIRRLLPFVGTIMLMLGIGVHAGLAHVTLKEPTAKAKTYYVATFRVPHGCGESPTVAVRVTIPPEVLIAKPMPKPGWRIDLVYEQLRQPVRGEHNNEITGRMTEITWTGGKLPAEYFDEFSMMVFLPARVGPLYFPTVQVCEEGELRWVDVPPEGKTAHDMSYPAPAVTLLPTERQE